MNPIRRRTFLQATLGTAIAAQAAPPKAGAPAGGLTDVNIHLGQWPFRRLPDDAPAKLAARLRKGGVQQAWAGSFEAILHRDLAAVNDRLARACQQHGPDLFLPVGTLNPAQPGWQDDLQRCIDHHGMKILRLYPNYHSYTLADPAFAKLLETATAKNLVIQIVAQLEDARTQHPQVQVGPVDFKPLPALLQSLPQHRVMILNANRSMTLTALAGTKVWVDIAMLEGVAGIENLLTDWPADRIVFGSHAPFFYWESAQLKLQESDLDEAKLRVLRFGNAQALTSQM
ncbi:MAG: amidohydrolase family protein [Verrucomicrobiales bacterium]|nr:amidohydrolase family protein [Verrucomicrobiales bacterium]MCP5558137.1 amidohydrolase family protein [Verrucomicrobiaceae bacterium]